MTPEKKAKEMVYKFYPHSQDIGQSKYQSKASATICCDEVIAEIEDLQQNCAMEFPMALEYWQQVRIAIQSL